MRHRVDIVFQYVATLTLAATLLVVGGCKSDNDSEPTVESVDNQIYFSTDMLETKGADLTEFSAGDQIGIWTYYDEQGCQWGNDLNDDPSALTSEFFNNVCLTASTYGDGYSWTYSPTQFWPEAGTLKSFAYYPYSSNNSTARITFSTTQTGYPTLSYRPLTNAENQYDLVTATSTTDECDGSGGYINLAFRHQLSKLSFSFAHDYECDEDETVTIYVRYITINNVKYYNGNFTDWEYFEGENDISNGYYTSGFEWDYSQVTGTHDSIKTGAYGGVYNTIAIAQYDAEVMEFTDVMKSDGTFMIHPQTIGTEDTPVIITYYLTYGNGQGTATITKSFTGESGVTLTKGGQTKIRLVLTADDITCDGFEIIPWEEENAEDDSESENDNRLDIDTGLDGEYDWGDPDIGVNDWEESNSSSEI